MADNLSGTEKRLRNLIPYKSGAEWKGNRKGRPKTFDEARALAQAILHRELVTKDGKKISVAEAILTSWAKTKEQQHKLIELAFGKVPDKLDTTIEDRRAIKLHWPHERPDLTRN